MVSISSGGILHIVDLREENPLSLSAPSPSPAPANDLADRVRRWESPVSKKENKYILKETTWPQSRHQDNGSAAISLTKKALTINKGSGGE